jgi:mitogen-activated protein kinase kinase
MAPERIQGSPYTVKSDVWSVGLTLMELAIGKFPFSIDSEDDDEAAGPQGILDLLQQIVLEPSPKLPKSDAFPSILEDVIAKCLMKDPKERPTPRELFDSDPFLQAAKRTPVDLRQWAVGMMEKQNRKSHLGPPLSPSTEALLRSEDPETSAPPARRPSAIAMPSNGSSAPPTARPQYPTRTSSSQSNGGYPQMDLPIRQAPGPGSRPSSRPGSRPDSRPGSRRLERERSDTAGSRDSYHRTAPRPGYPDGSSRQYQQHVDSYQ